ncbi:hypothetical protein BT69DRAFT_1338308 [Atractiella rhizophila]|nr:hypothetical protein BT69DRAFT_1338308 [Atractiella rhizophila]
MNTAASFQLGGSAFVDCLLCLLFVLALKKQVKRTDFSTTTDLIWRLIYCAIGINLVTSSLRVLELILFLACPQTAYHIAIGLLVPNVCVSSILGLISQARLRMSSFCDTPSHRSVGTCNSLELDGRTVREVAHVAMPDAEGVVSVKFDIESQGLLFSNTSE